MTDSPNREKCGDAPAAAAPVSATNSTPAKNDALATISSRLSLGVLGLLLLCYGYVHQDYTGGTSLSRLDLLQALVRQGTLCIDRYQRNTSDKALFKGHYYSDKAPGVVVLALPAFAVGEVLASDTTSVDASWNDNWLFPSWLATTGSVALLTALGGACYFAWLCRWVSPTTALVAALALFLGAAPFPYATMLFSHGMVIGLLSITLWAIGREQEGQRIQVGRFSLDGYLLAGFCCGWVLASEFTAGLVVAGIFVWVCATGWRSAMRFCLASVPPLLLIPAYSWACFDSPFTLGYDHQATFPAMKEGLYGIGWPDAPTGLKLLFSPDRGLFFWSPFLLMAAAGFPVLFKRSRSLFWLCLAVTVAQIVVISGEVWDWRAGWTLGPRYLSPMLPLLALPAALGIQRFPRLGCGLALLSVLLTGTGTVVNATPRYEITNPLMELHLPGLWKGEVTHNLGQMLGLPGLWSLAPLVVLAVCYLWWMWTQLRELDRPD